MGTQHREIFFLGMRDLIKSLEMIYMTVPIPISKLQSLTKLFLAVHSFVPVKFVKVAVGA